MTWNIRAFNGMGPLYFGMKAEEVSAVQTMGKPERIVSGYDGSVVEFRAIDIPMCNYVNGGLAVIDTSRRVVGVKFGDMDIYETPPLEVLVALEKASGKVLSGLGTLLFTGIGLNVAGFYFPDTNDLFDPALDQDDRGVAAYQPGAFDAMLSEYKPVTFL